MELIYTRQFHKAYTKIKDKTTRIRVQNALQKLQFYPEAGKPLRYCHAGERSLRIPPFRIIYRIEQERIIILAFDHRKDAYD